MSSFGNISASSLLSSANAAANKTQSYNDSLAGYQWDLSAKDQSAYQAYTDYLNKQATKYQSDPSKVLTYAKAATGAQKSYTSSEIGRISTQIKYGNTTNQGKYSAMAQLRDAAIQNGDQNLAQSLEGQMASLDVAIQNQAKSDATAASTAQNKAYTSAMNRLSDGVNQLKAAKAAGQITPADYADRMRQMYLGNPATNSPGIISLANAAKEATGDPNGTYQSKLDSIAADSTVQGFVNGAQQAQGQAGNLFNKTITSSADGTYNFHDRPASEVAGNVVLKDANGNPIMDANGHAVTSQIYTAPQAFTDTKGKINGFQYATNINAQGGMAPGTGAGAIRQIGQQQINYDDPSGVPYFINEAGQKKFIGLDKANGKAIMGNDPSVVSGSTKDAGKSVGLPNVYSAAYGNVPSAAGKVATKALGNGSFLSNAIGGALHLGPLQSLIQQSQHAADAKASADALAKAQQALVAARSTMAPTVAARIATPAAPINYTPAGAAVIKAAPINTPTISQAQAASANFVGANGGYQTNITAPKASPSIAARIGSFLGF